MLCKDGKPQERQGGQVVRLPEQKGLTGTPDPDRTKLHAE